jgi:hypothetical protein
VVGDAVVGEAVVGGGLDAGGVAESLPHDANSVASARVDRTTRRDMADLEVGRRMKLPVHGENLVTARR